MLKSILLMISLIAFVNALDFNVYFYLFTKAKPSPTKVTETTLTANGFGPAKKTIFLAHGFTDGLKTTTMIEIVNEILKREDVNAIFVDWSEGAAAPNYVNAANRVDDVGNRISEFMKKANINPATVHCIGHSLGSHVCGNAGRPVKLMRISAMDPAGPLFQNIKTNDRLSINDANFVDAIHTDQILGYDEPIGHMDFFPNGGQVQPGCTPKSIFSWDFVQYNLTNPLDLISCSHSRVIRLYASSVRSLESPCKFLSVVCPSYSDLRANKCSPTCANNACPVMGYYADKTRTKTNSVLFLNTNKVEPYCLK